MAITGITGIETDQLIAAFNNVPVSVETDDSGVTLIKADIIYDGATYLTEISPIFLKGGVRKSFFNLKNSFSSILFDTSKLNINPEYNNKKVNITFTEIKESGGTETIEDVIIYKSINLGTWSGDTSFLAIENKDIKRFSLKGQSIYIGVYSDLSTATLYHNNNNIETLSFNNNYTISDEITLNTSGKNEFKVGSDSNKLIVYVSDKYYKRNKMLYWLNEYGGWDFYPIIDYESTDVVDKSQYNRHTDYYGNTEVYQFIEGSVKRMKLDGYPGTSESIGYIKGLFRSPVIYDENGDKLRVTTNRIKWDQSGILERRSNIEYIDEKVINF